MSVPDRETHGVAPPRIAALLFVALASWLAFPLASRACPPPTPYSAMRLTFASDFRAATRLDATRWRPMIGQHGADPDALAVSTPEEVVAGGAQGLALRLDKKPLWGHPYRRAVITTHGLFSQLYGHFEMLAKMPDANGMWPAFWLLPESGHWPPEIDVVEFIHLRGKPTGGSGEPVTTLHWPDAKKRQAAIGRSNGDLFLALIRAGAGKQGFHNYAVDWRPQSVTFSIDGRTAFCVEDAGGEDRVPHEPMYMVLSSGVSSGTPQEPAWAGFVEPDQKFPVDFIVASVKVYQFADIGDPPPLDLDLPRIRLARDRIAPGETLKVTVEVVAGAHDLAAPHVEMQVRRFFDSKTWDGSTSYGKPATIDLAPMKAGEHRAATLQFAMPRDAKPGYYSLYMRANAARADSKDGAVATWKSAGRETFTVASAAD